ncbi:hypothetical protein [Paenibacillus qinlingensis]|uniref:Type IV pilus assembly protein PilO n=1 Tax=Paenibacillus qinlingensis TaxID=1837343 RepID=A0ABU1NQC1_9BACL|nr:hypothetical protein [Paenibacillus qinlingensis]MDR6549675.1 type IV pilus assembly protein PilO [Paenibacillus qinlingensis]
MSNKNNQQTLLLFVAVLLFLGLFAFYYFVQIPSSTKVKNQANEVSALDKQIQLLTQKVSEKQKSNPGPSMKDVQAALPLWDNTEQLTLDLNKIRTEQNVTFSSIAYSMNDKTAQPADATKKNAFPNVREIKVTTTLNGTFKEVSAALTQLQSLPRLINVDAVNYGNLPKEANKKITVNLSFTAYFDPSYKSKVDKIESPY